LKKLLIFIKIGVTKLSNAIESVWSVSKLSTEAVGSRRQLVANCVHTADADATKQFRRVGFTVEYYINKKLSYCWETVRRESMPRIAEMDVEITT